MGLISNWFISSNFQQVLYTLYNNGWFAFVFPFMLMYAIIFTATNSISVFQEKKSVRIIVSFIISLFAVSFNISGQGGLITFNMQNSLGFYMSSLFPGVGVFSIFVLALYIIASLFGLDLSDIKFGNKTYLKYILFGIGSIVILYYVGKGLGWFGFGYIGTTGFGWWLYQLFSDPSLYIIILFGLFFVWISSEDDPRILAERKKILAERKALKKKEKKFEGDNEY